MSTRFEVDVQGRARAFPRRVWFAGSTALDLGVAVCYLRTVNSTKPDGTSYAATDADEERDRQVGIPDAANQYEFAGVTAAKYAAVSGGQFIEIWEPGSTCLVRASAATTINTFGSFQINDANGITFLATPTLIGQFQSAVLPHGAGQGTVRWLQTIGAAGLCLAKLQIGEQRGGFESFTPIAASVVSVGGVSQFLASGAVAVTMANGVFVGQRKILQRNTTSSAVTVGLGAAKGRRNVATTDTLTDDKQVAGVTFANVAITSNAEFVDLEWNGREWRVVSTNLAYAKFS